MRPIQTIAILILTALFVALSICSPDFLSKNKFLVDFVNHEYINVLSVVVTVSLVSVTQIHLEYSRIERRFKVKVFEEARKTINLGALLLTSMLVLSFVISFIRAELIGNPIAVSLIHGISLITVITCVFVMYDLVRTVYVLASDEPVDEDEEASDEPEPS